MSSQGAQRVLFLQASASASGTTTAKYLSTLASTITGLAEVAGRESFETAIALLAELGEQAYEQEDSRSTASATMYANPRCVQGNGIRQLTHPTSAQDHPARSY